MAKQEAYSNLFAWGHSLVLTPGDWLLKQVWRQGGRCTSYWNVFLVLTFTSFFWMQDDLVKLKEAKEARHWSPVLLLHHDKNVTGEEVSAS